MTANPPAAAASGNSSDQWKKARSSRVDGHERSLARIAQRAVRQRLLNRRRRQRHPPEERRIMPSRVLVRGDWEGAKDWKNAAVHTSHARRRRR
jgi:hypothetical protein